MVPRYPLCLAAIECLIESIKWTNRKWLCWSQVTLVSGTKLVSPKNEPWQWHLAMVPGLTRVSGCFYWVHKMTGSIERFRNKFWHIESITDLQRCSNMSVDKFLKWLLKNCFIIFTGVGKCESRWEMCRWWGSNPYYKWSWKGSPYRL